MVRVTIFMQGLPPRMAEKYFLKKLKEELHIEPAGIFLYFNCVRPPSFSRPIFRDQVEGLVIFMSEQAHGEWAGGARLVFDRSCFCSNG